MFRWQLWAVVTEPVAHSWNASQMAFQKPAFFCAFLQCNYFCVRIHERNSKKGILNLADACPGEGTWKGENPTCEQEERGPDSVSSLAKRQMWHDLFESASPQAPVQQTPFRLLDLTYTAPNTSSFAVSKSCGLYLQWELLMWVKISSQFAVLAEPTAWRLCVYILMLMQCLEVSWLAWARRKKISFQHERLLPSYPPSLLSPGLVDGSCFTPILWHSCSFSDVLKWFRKKYDGVITLFQSAQMTSALLFSLNTRAWRRLLQGRKTFSRISPKICYFTSSVLMRRIEVDVEEKMLVSLSPRPYFSKKTLQRIFLQKEKNKTWFCNLGTGWYSPPPLDENMNVRPSFDFSKDVYILGFVQNLFLESDFSDVVASVFSIFQSILKFPVNLVLSVRKTGWHRQPPGPEASFFPSVLSQAPFNLLLRASLVMATMLSLACSLHMPSPAPSLDRQTLAESLILPDTEERTSCKVLLLLLLLKRTEHEAALQTIWQIWPTEKSVKTKMIISGYRRKLLSSQRWIVLEWLLSAPVWLAPLIILPQHLHWFFPFMALVEKKKKKKRCFAAHTAYAS